MNSRSKLVFAAAAAAVAFASQAFAADPAPAPTATPAAQPSAAPAPAGSLDRKALIGAPVSDNKGEAIGEVKSVKVGPDGKVVAIDVSTADNKMVSIPADGVTVADNKVTTKKSKAEILAH